ncbi:MAG: hypothetical protein R3E96_06345 [Planctomycetota bacterium]
MEHTLAGPAAVAVPVFVHGAALALVAAVCCLPAAARACEELPRLGIALLAAHLALCWPRPQGGARLCFAVWLPALGIAALADRAAGLDDGAWLRLAGAGCALLVASAFFGRPGHLALRHAALLLGVLGPLAWLLVLRFQGAALDQSLAQYVPAAAWMRALSVPGLPAAGLVQAAASMALFAGLVELLARGRRP